MPAGVHGSGPGVPMTRRPRFSRVQPVDVLGRVDGQEGRLLVEAGRERDLDQVGVNGRVGVEPGDHGLELVLAHVGGKVLVDRDDAHLGRSPRASWPRSGRWRGRRRPGWSRDRGGSPSGAGRRRRRPPRPGCGRPRSRRSGCVAGTTSPLSAGSGARR